MGDGAGPKSRRSADSHKGRDRREDDARFVDLSERVAGLESSMTGVVASLAEHKEYVHNRNHDIVDMIHGVSGSLQTHNSAVQESLKTLSIGHAQTTAVCEGTITALTELKTSIKEQADKADARQDLREHRIADAKAKELEGRQEAARNKAAFRRKLIMYLLPGLGLVGASLLSWFNGLLGV